MSEGEYENTQLHPSTLYKDLPGVLQEFALLSTAHTCRIGSSARISAPTCRRIRARSGPWISLKMFSSSKLTGDFRQQIEK